MASYNAHIVTIWYLTLNTIIIILLNEWISLLIYKCGAFGHTYITNLWFISNCESTEIAAVWESAITDYPLNLAVETFANWTVNIFIILRLIPTWEIQLTQRCNEMD